MCGATTGAALEYHADDNARAFYARLSTKADIDIYTDYGDPVDADLWFYNFIGNPEIPSTSRAWLTLGIPWDEDSDYHPDPRDVYIYQVDKYGDLEDVTDRFTYSDDAYAIEGWTIRTRQLGTYIISDTELDLDTGYEMEYDWDDDAYEEQYKVNPVTGGGTQDYTPGDPPRQLRRQYRRLDGRRRLRAGARRRANRTTRRKRATVRSPPSRSPRRSPRSTNRRKSPRARASPPGRSYW